MTVDRHWQNWHPQVCDPSDGRKIFYVDHANFWHQGVGSMSHKSKTDAPQAASCRAGEFTLASDWGADITGRIGHTICHGR
jgi:hypothetical protein